MAIAASPNSTALPSTDLSGIVSAIQQAVAQINSLLPALQVQLGTGAAAGASTLAGGPGQAPNQLPGQSAAQAPGSGCGCHGGAGAAAGAASIGQAPTGAAGAPNASGGMLERMTQKVQEKQKGSSGGGANAAPEADEEAKADKATPAAPAGSSKGRQMVEEARKYLGTPYVFGGASPKGFDCSGLLLYVARKFGIDLPHKASIQATMGTAVDKANLQPGDMVFFRTDGSGNVSHAGMYVGDGQFIHAPKTGDVVKISNINDSYYRDKWAGARRMG